MQFVQHRFEESRSVLVIDTQALLNIATFWLLCCVGITIGLQLFWVTFDDMYITYRYSYNLASGNGFVYNIGERYLGTTAPLFGFVLGILGIPNPDAIPTIGAIIGVLAFIACSTGLYAFGIQVQQRLVGFLAGLFFVVNPIMMQAFSSEMFVQVAFITWALVTYKAGKTHLTAFLLALAVLTRFDAILCVAIIGVYHLITKKQIPWKEIGIFLLILTPVLLSMWMYYGDPLPGTMESKRAQGATDLWTPFFKGSFSWIQATTIQDSNTIFGLKAAPHMIRFIYLLGLGVIGFIWNVRAWILPVLWSASYTIVYSLLDVPFYHWYLVNIMYGLVIITALGAWLLVKLVQLVATMVATQSRYISFIYPVATIALVLALTPGTVSHIRFIDHYAQTHHGPEAKIQSHYVNFGKWVNQNLPEDASVGFIEIGMIGYFGQRTIIDALGLVNPGIAPAIANKDFTWAYRTYMPDYIVHTPVFPLGAEEEWFQQQYYEYASVEFRSIHFKVYKRVNGVNP